VSIGLLRSAEVTQANDRQGVMAGEKHSVSPYLLRPLRTLEQVLRDRSRMGRLASKYSGALPTRDEQDSRQEGEERNAQPATHGTND
jgi:hypothetical protein